MGYKALPRVTGVTRGLPGVTRGYKRSERVPRDTGAYKGLPGVTKGFKRSKSVTGGCKRLKEFKKGLQGVTTSYKGLLWVLRG